MEPSKNKEMRRIVSEITSLSGYMVGSILIGMYVDDKFFNRNGISVIIALLLAILGMIIKIIKLVIVSRDN